MSETSKKKKLLWIGWDGSDWEHISPLLDQGLLPNLEKFIEEGVMGNLATLQPVLSPMLWNSAATGKHAYKHGILGFTEPDKFNGGARPYSSYSRKCKAIWNMLSQKGYRSNVINWWASHPAEKINGCVVSNLINGVKFGPNGPIAAEGAIHPAERSKFYSQFKAFAEELTEEQLCAFVPLAKEINQDEDSRLHILAKTLAETITTHSVATAVMEKEAWDFMAIYYTCHDHFAHAFMPYHPPRLPWIPEKDYEIFKDVVNGSYRFSDMMLGRLLQFTDEDTTVIICSDHGFQSGSQRPRGNPKEPTGPAIWHRRYGIFLMKGPNVKKDERIYGASLIDLTPTMLVALGEPIGEDMDGRPLLEAFVDPPEVKTIASWEDVPGEHGMHDEEVPLPPEEAEELMQQMVALGYVDDPGDDKDKQHRNAEIECDYNLSRNYVFTGQNVKAMEIMEKVIFRAPWETRFIQHLAQCYQATGYYRQALRLVEVAFPDLRDSKYLLMKLVWCECQFALGNDSESVLEFFKQIEEENKTNSRMMYRIAATYSKFRKWKDAQRVFEKALDIHDENAEAWQGLSRVFIRQGMNQEAVDAGLNAVSLIHRLPHAHFNIGIGMARSGDFERAEQAFRNVLNFSPGFIRAHRWLSYLYRKHLGNDEMSKFHAVQTAAYQSKRRLNEGQSIQNAETLRELPEILPPKERQEALDRERPDRIDPRKSSGKEFVLVSGLPRSGTSLMMQILEAGGMQIKTDGERIADDDNPRGYYEWEDIKKIVSKPQILEEEGLEDKAIKVVSAILANMPYNHQYKVIFMTRPIEEVVASQSRMIENRGTSGMEQDEKETAKVLFQHRESALRWMEQNPRVEYLEVDYPGLVANPQDVLPIIVDFLGHERLSLNSKMSEVVDSRLYRQKSN